MDSDELLVLAAILAKDVASELGVVFEGFTAAAEGALQLQRFPEAGAAKSELRPRLQRALTVTGGGRLSSGDLFPDLPLDFDLS